MAPTFNFAFAGGEMPATFQFKGSLQKQLEDAEVRGAQLETKLEQALEQVRLLSAERDVLGAERDKAKELARNSFNQLRASSAPSPQSATMADNSSTFDKLQDLQHENENLRTWQQADKLTIEQYQEDLQNSELKLKEQESQITKTNERLTENQVHLKETKEEHDRILAEYRDQIQQLESAKANLERKVEDLNAAAAHDKTTLGRTHDELDAHREAFNVLSHDKDTMEAQMLDLQMRYDSLFQQWQEDQDKIEELQGRDDMVAQHEAAIKNFETDLAALQETIAENYRALTVKDERIAHLEAQFQKERQRNLNAADAAADATVAAVTSNDHEAPPSLSGLGASLADELSQEYDSDDYNEPYESEHFDSPPNKFSPIFQVAEITPIEPPTQRLSIGLGQDISVSPVDAATQRLTVHVHENTSISPIEVVTPRLTLSDIHETVTVTPVERAINVTSASVQTDLQDLTTQIVHAASLDTTPIAPAVVPTTTISTQTEAPRLASGIVQNASIAVAPTAPTTNITLSPIVVTLEEVPTEPLTATTATNSIAPIIVTHEDTPIAVRSTEPTTTSASVQTAETPQETTETHIIEVVKPNKVGFLQAVLPIISLLLAFLSLWQYMQLQAWETANDYGYGSSGNRGGAYGNGRHLFGIPLAMDIGDNWWTEQLAKIASSAITGFEKWAGVEYTPTY